MTIDTGNLLEPTNVRKPGDFHRNHQGAPYVTHPTEVKRDGTPKRVVYGRPSSFGSALDNAFSLIKWKERQLLIGAGILDPDWSQFTDRDQLDGLAAQCHEAAGSSLAADRGTHIHLLLEMVDRGLLITDDFHTGEELGIPEALQRQIISQWSTFRDELGVTALAIEATVVHDGWRLAGTLDRHDLTEKDILTGFGIIAAGQSFIGDIKTGGLTLGRDGQPNYWVKFPVQVVGYRDGVPYDVETDTRGDWGEHVPHPDIALIYHYDLAQALEGIPTDWQAIPVNLTAGREGGDLCRLAADFGRRRDLFLMPTPKERESCSDITGTSTQTKADTSTEIPASTTAASEITSEFSPTTSTTNLLPLLTRPEPTGDGPVVDDFHIVVSDGRRGSVTVPTSRTYIHAKVRELAGNGHEAVVRREWPAGVPSLTDRRHTVEQLTQLFHMVRRVETEVGAPFDPEPVVGPEPDHYDEGDLITYKGATHIVGVDNGSHVYLPELPDHLSTLDPHSKAGQWGYPDKYNRWVSKKDVTLVSRKPATQPNVPDDGAFLDPGEIELLKARMLALPDHRHIQLADISREANAAGRPISVTQKPCVRRWEIARALILWAEGDPTIDNLETLWLAVVIVANEKQITDDNITLGALISQFTIEQACQLADTFQPVETI